MERGAWINTWMQRTWEAFEVATAWIPNLFSALFIYKIDGCVNRAKCTLGWSWAHQGDVHDTHPLSPVWLLIPSDAPEKISLQILSKGPIIEGNNVTLKCHADGNPQPSAFYFHLKVSETLTGLRCCRIAHSEFSQCPNSETRASHRPLRTFKLPFWNCHKRGGKAIIKTCNALLDLI